MPPKKPNDEFDLSEFDDLLRREKAPEAAGFDISEFTLDDFDLFLETDFPELDLPREPAFAKEEDLELNSFMKFYDEPLRGEAAPVSENAPAEDAEDKGDQVPAVPEEPTIAAADIFPDMLEEDEETEEEERPRASLTGLFGRRHAEVNESEEEDGLSHDESDETDEFEEDDEADRPRFSLGGLFGRRRPETDEPEPEEAAEDDESDGVDEYQESDEDEEDERPRFSLASLFGRRNSEEEEVLEDETDKAEENDRSRLSLTGLFGRRNAEQEEPEELLPEEEPVQKPGRLSMDKEKLFAMLYPRKKSGEDNEGEAEETKPEAESAGAAEPQAVQVVPKAVAAQGAAWQDLPREPRAGEMLVLDSELDEIDYYDEEDLPEIRDYMPVRFARYGRLGIGGGLMYALFVISVSVILACAGWLFASDVLALNKPDTTSIVTIVKYVPGPEDVYNEDGDPVDEEGNVIQVDIDQVASALKSSGVIEYKWLFKLFAELSTAHAKIDPGTYDVSAKLDYRALVTEMQTGSESQEITRITIPEGYSMEQIFQLLEDNGICEKEELYEQAANYDFSYEWLEDLPLGDATRLEGYLFPDTYDFYQGESAVNAIDRFLNRFHYILTMDMYTQADNLGISLHEAVIIASLIEKEAGAEDDRSLFSSVIHNRLYDGWKLQLDSTLNYIKGTSTFDLTYEDMEIDSPYNTYLYEGLPAGPICSPGKASLEAALNPSSTNYWYWYAYEGVTYFFSSGSAFDEFAAAHPY